MLSWYSSLTLCKELLLVNSVAIRDVQRCCVSWHSRDQCMINCSAVMMTHQSVVFSGACAVMKPQVSALLQRLCSVSIQQLTLVSSKQSSGRVMLCDWSAQHCASIRCAMHGIFGCSSEIMQAAAECNLKPIAIFLEFFT